MTRVGGAIQISDAIHIDVAGRTQSFRLYAVVTHDGSFMTGHYKAFIYENVWWKYNDKEVHKYIH